MAEGMELEPASWVFFLLSGSMDVKTKLEVQSYLAVWLGFLEKDHGDVFKCMNCLLILNSQWLGAE